MKTQGDTIPDSTKTKPPTLPPVVLIMLFMSMLLQPVFAEIGYSVPKEVLSERQAARVRINELEIMITQLIEDENQTTTIA